MFKYIERIHTNTTILSHMALILIFLSLLSLLGIVLDDRLVGGINLWIKPLKFDISIAIFLVTMAWILQYTNAIFAREISLKISICMFVEITLITLQAARGVASHFNNSHSIDSLIFGTMGIFISYNTYLILKTFIELLKRPPNIPLVYLRSIQYGLISLISGSLIGGYMSSQKGHNVGAPDGGPGLSVLNWSTIVGDIRVAHFLGLHNIQILILAGAVLSFSKFRSTEKKGLFIITCIFVFLTSMNLGILIQALMGQPFIKI